MMELTQKAVQKVDLATEIISEIEKGTGTQFRHINPNKKIRTNNTSGITGVSYCPSCSKPWVASICIKGKRIHRNFDTKEEAIKCRLLMEDTFHRPIYEAMKKELSDNKILVPPNNELNCINEHEAIFCENCGITDTHPMYMQKYCRFCGSELKEVYGIKQETQQS